MNSKKYFISIVVLILITVTGCTAQQDSSIVYSAINEDKITQKDGQNIETPIDHIGLKVEQMTLEEKIGQLVLVGMEGHEINENIKEFIHTYHVGGIILYGKNIKDSNQLLSLINSLKSENAYNKIPLFISVDEEGGAVSRNPKEIKKLPTARKIGSTSNRDVAFEAGQLLGQTLKKFGYNMNFAPVLDIDSNPRNPIIGNRSFGSTVEVVSTMGLEVMNGIKNEGVIPVIKHFPGHGDTTVDSHIGLPVVEYDLDRLRSFEIVPFKGAIDNGADVVMVAHILMSKIDHEYPASMSKTLITDILRNDLGFEGVVITDDMTMGAIEKNYNIGNAAIQSINAGADIILVGHNYDMQIEVLNAVKDAVDSSIISLDRIDESVYRILKLKEEYELQDQITDTIDLKEINDGLDAFLNKIRNK